MARIRSIKPEAFTSETLSAVSRAARWTFAGLWTYCDDEGRGRGDPRLIKAALYPLDDDVSVDDVVSDLDELEAVGVLCRYEHGGRAYLHVTNFFEHQHPNRPVASKLPECSRSTHGGLTEDSVSAPLCSRSSRGVGEEREVKPPSTAVEVARIPGAFDAFWNAYPRKVGKVEAKKVFDAKARSVPASTIIDGALRLASDPNLPETQFIPHPATWLRRGGWDDEPLPARTNGRQATTDDVFSRAAARAAERERNAG